MHHSLPHSGLPLPEQGNADNSYTTVQLYPWCHWRARDILPLTQVLQCVFSVFQWQQRQRTAAETLGYPHLVLRPVWGRTLSFQKIIMNSCSGTGVKLALCGKPQYRTLTSTEVFGSCYVYHYKTRRSHCGPQYSNRSCLAVMTSQSACSLPVGK